MLKCVSHSVNKAVFLSLILLNTIHATVFVVSRCMWAGKSDLNYNNNQQYNVHPVPSAHEVHI